MSQIPEINNETTKTTMQIIREYLKLYPFLDETPSNVTLKEETKIDMKDLSKYLNRLTQLLSYSKKRLQKQVTNKSQ